MELTVRVAIVVSCAGGALLACAGDGAASTPSSVPAGADTIEAPAAPAASSPAEPPFACAGQSSRPEQLRRLTMTQYRNTLADLAAWALGDPLEGARAVSLAGLDALPFDRREPTARDPHGSYRRFDQALDQTHVDETYRVATTLAAALTTPARLGRVAGACSTDGNAENDEACVANFLRSFGARALRRPLAEEDARFYRAVYGSDPTANPAAYADVIAVMLSAPEFLYFIEHGEAEVVGQPGTYRLSSHELASRLSYHVWQTLPDQELWQTAEDRSLLQADVLERQIERLLSDPRARTTMAEWFSDLLRLTDVPLLDTNARDPRFAAFAGTDMPGPERRQHILGEALDMLAFYTWTSPGSVRDLFTSELSFARSDDLARIYGAEPWDGISPPPAMPAGERVGLLTRAWFLAGASANTRPIMRGVFVRRQLLCDDLAPPPGNVDAMPPALRADRTTRQVVEELTEQPGTTCASCHATLINPLGFAFEGFDSIGRVRVVQRLFDDAGQPTTTLPIDTRSVPHVRQDDDRVSTGPSDLNQLMLESGKLEACLARNYFRFTFGRYEDLADDGCALERLRARLAESGRIRDLIAEAALLPEFSRRRFEAPP